MKLNLGCQLHMFLGWVNVDVVGDDKDWKPDLVCDVSKLPYEDESVDFIYAGHLVEHFFPDTIHVAIAEWYRVLKPGGTLVVVTPDCGAVFKDYASGKLSIDDTWQQVYGRINHYDTPSERHHIAFDVKKLTSVMDIAPSTAWSNMVPLDFNNPPAEIAPFMDVHISRATYQLGLVLTK